MKLTQLFSGGARTDGPVHTAQPNPALAEQISRQLRALVPGQTISGEIVGRNGSEVQIKLSEDMILNARVDRNLNLEIGKNMTFEVKNNGSALTLSPLFTNVSADMNVLKALEMAGLPVNRTTVDMTEQLMAAGMSVNKNMLQQIFREISGFPEAEVSDVVNLHKLQMPVNEANINQMVSYRNLTHQLSGGLDAILEALPEAMDSLMQKGDVQGAVKLYQEVLALVQEGDLSVSGGEKPPVLPGMPGGTGEGVSGLPEAGSLPGEGALSEEMLLPGNGILSSQEGTKIVFGEGGVLLGQNPEILKEEGAVLPGGQAPEDSGGPGALSGEGMLSSAVTAERGKEALPEGELLRFQGEILSGENTAETEGALPEALRLPAAREALELLSSVRLPAEEASALRTQILQFAQGQTDAGQFFAGLSALISASRNMPGAGHMLEKLFSGGHIRRLLAGQLKNSWMLRPEEIASPGKVEELYRRLDRQLKTLGSALEEAGQTGSAAYRATAAMSQNVDFLQQVNQMYAYVQLPLRLQHRDAHGELYVYTNKKKMSDRDGNVSALLHLDMENLGTVDVYVAMKNSKVSTKFYLRDDEMIDFLGAHMEVLTGRLRKRGYECSTSMVRRSEAAGEATEGGLDPLLRQEKGRVLSQYSFDVRT